LEECDAAIGHTTIYINVATSDISASR